MKLKNEINQKKDILYLVIAIVLTAALAAYLFFFVHSLVQKADVVFSTNQGPSTVITFDFERYEKVMNKALPSTSTISLPAATSTATTTASSSSR